MRRCYFFLLGIGSHAQSAPPKAPEKVIFDTDIGDGIDDAFAVALALRSPELKILGISTTFGDAALRAKLLDRLLGEVGREDIPVAIGSPSETAYLRSAGTPSAGASREPFTQALLISFSTRVIIIPMKSLSLRLDHS